MNKAPIEHYWYDLVRHFKGRWTEVAVIVIFIIALMYLILTSPVSNV